MSVQVEQFPLFDPEAFQSDDGAQIVDYGEVIERLELEPTMVKAVDLIDETFVILGGKQFPSSYENQDHAWYCVCEDLKQTERFAVVLGGQAVMKILDAMAASGFSNPLKVTLKQKTGGKYGRYYVFE